MSRESSGRGCLPDNNRAGVSAMKVIATKAKAVDLKPGDLFSTADQTYWTSALKYKRDNSVGETVYIRTNVSCPEDQVDVDIYLITIERGDEE